MGGDWGGASDVTDAFFLLYKGVSDVLFFSFKKGSREPGLRRKITRLVLRELC